jgi:hypothetical protein
MEYRDLQYYIRLAENGSKASIDEIMRHLNRRMTIAESKYIDQSRPFPDKGIS